MHRQANTKHLSVEFLALFGLAGMAVWFCDDMLFGGKVPFFRDLGTYSYPIKFSLAKSLQAGELPLWDRNMAGGFPLFAAFQPAAFYPPSVAFYLFPFFDAVRWTFFIHFLIAASGAYYLCRRWRYPVYLSVVGAILFAFGGTTISLSNLLNHFQTAVWLPWMILCWERLLEAPSWKNFLILILVLLSALLAGSPEIYFFSLGLLLIDGIRLSLRDRGISATRIVLLLVSANLLVAALGMVQFLPTAELLLHSRRDRPIPFNEATHWSLDPISIIGLVFPDKEADGAVPFGVRLFFTGEVPFLLSHYLGVLSFLSLCAWVFYASWRERIIAATLIAISLALALGKFTPIYGYLFEAIAAFRIIRFPEKYFFLTYAFLLFGVLKGLAALHPLKDSRRNFPVIVLFGLLMLWVTAYSLCRFYPEILSDLVVQLSGIQAATPGVATSTASVFYNLERQIAVTGALLLLYFCTSQGLIRAGLHHVFLILIVLLDLGVAHKPLQFLLEPDAVTKTDRILTNSNAGESRVFYYPTGRNLHPSSVVVAGWPSFQKTVELSFNNLLPNAGIFYGFDYFQEIDAITRQPYNDFLNFANLLPPEKRTKLFRALNIRYVVAFQPLDIPGMRLTHRFPQHFSWLYEIDGPVPRAYIAPEALYEARSEKTLRLLASAEFDSLRQVILNEQPASVTGRTTGGEATVVRYSNNTVLIKASLAGSGVLVLTDSYYPGWKVFVDGKESRILQANHFFRGVQLSPGNHTVEFRYVPLSFKVGLAISLFTVLVLTLISLARLRWRKRRSQSFSTAISHAQLIVQQK